LALSAGTAALVAASRPGGRLRDGPVGDSVRGAGEILADGADRAWWALSAFGAGRARKRLVRGGIALALAAGLAIGLGWWGTAGLILAAVGGLWLFETGAAQRLGAGALRRALLRPGRFDRQVLVDRPDLHGRLAILKIHSADITLGDDIDLDRIARRTPGFVGADLANLLNEAALLAARRDKVSVSMQEIEDAVDRIVAGLEKKNRLVNEKERRIVAFHEAGHAIVGRVVPEHDPVYKVTIIPRGRALGVTMYLPEGDKYSFNRTAIESQLCSLYGGRVAEELIFGNDKVTTGASNDIERATKMARNMVTKWGLSDEMGPIAYSDDEDEVFLGRSVTQHKSVSDDTARRIDEVVRGILDKAYARTSKILKDHLDQLHVMAETLLLYETIDAKQIDDIMGGRTPGPPADWSKSDKPPKDDGRPGAIGGPAAQT
ncbi:MAG: hypothetical protein KY442_09905, partial [Proteobacteria bacterium]|nr:hypothetical protein [Pseudomonadota bacterium]